MKLVLRGHHLLCLQGFQGYGYDRNFIENMERINRVRKTENITVKLINSPDDICSSCPNLKNNLCENETQNQRIIDMDNEVLQKLDTSKEYDSINLFENVAKKFNSKTSVEKICSKCMWHNECLFYRKL